jgi:hypothetical protein
MTAILEHDNGDFEVISYDDFCQRTNRQPKGSIKSVSVTNEVKLSVENVTLPM